MVRVLISSFTLLIVVASHVIDDTRSVTDVSDDTRVAQALVTRSVPVRDWRMIHDHISLVREVILGLITCEVTACLAVPLGTRQIKR